ncbi:putative Thyrotropin-releasing hormone receptor, partial [Hypsibius exemplaris]
VSLAYADLIVLFSAVPEAIVFHHARQWILGHVGCSVLIFSNFLGINAGSLSILAFTIERYSCCYAAHAVTADDATLTQHQRCQSARVLSVPNGGGLSLSVPNGDGLSLSVPNGGGMRLSVPTGCGKQAQMRCSIAMNNVPTYLATLNKKRRTQAMPMLVVALFAVCWLPFRGLLVYNSIASEPWLDLWYLLFAKTLIYLNSAINPFLYNFLSSQFRAAVFRFLGIRVKRPLTSQSTRSFSTTLHSTYN